MAFRNDVPVYKAIILDRDGVINVDSPHYVRTLDAWHPIDGSLEAIAALSVAGFRVAVASNQSGVGRCHLRLSELHRMHERLTSSVAKLGGQIDAIHFCPHLPSTLCTCRKPRPGLLHRASVSMRVPLAQCLFVGDSDGDEGAARQAGCRFIRIGVSEPGNPGPTGMKLSYPDLRALTNDLLENQP